MPLVPALPVVRKGGDPIRRPEDLGLVGCRPDLMVIPIVFLTNVLDVAGRSLASLYDDPAVRRECYADLAALAREWQPD
jgi:hypothetical protein